MLSTISGNVAHLDPHQVVLEVSGVGFEIAISPRLSLKLKVGERASLFTRLIVREDDLSLFGFAERIEREQFDLLCSVSGIGPKLALTVLSGMDSNQLAQAVSSGDEAAFRAISGIGPKTAKLILISLGGKVTSEGDPTRARVLQALIQLGTEEATARAALNQIPSGEPESDLLRKALSLLGSGKLG